MGSSAEGYGTISKPDRHCVKAVFPTDVAKQVQTLSKEYEVLIESSEADIYLAMIYVIIRRLFMYHYLKMSASHLLDK